jgi:hypothetical protein
MREDFSPHEGRFFTQTYNKTKKENKKEYIKQTHKTNIQNKNNDFTQEDGKALRQALEKMTNEPIAPLKRA